MFIHSTSNLSLRTKNVAGGKAVHSLKHVALVESKAPAGLIV